MCSHPGELPATIPCQGCKSLHQLLNTKSSLRLQAVPDRELWSHCIPGEYSQEASFQFPLFSALDMHINHWQKQTLYTDKICLTQYMTALKLFTQ